MSGVASRFLSGVVLLAGTQTVTGDKTFSGDVIVPATPANANSAAGKTWVENQITAAVVVNRPWKETLLDDAQLIGGASGGIAPAGAFVFADNPSEDETFALKNTAGGTEAYTFKASPSGETQVQIGVDLATTLASLAAAIEAKTGPLYHAYVRTNLQSIDALALVVSRRVVGDGTDRAYGTAGCSYVPFTATKYEAVAADLAALSTTDPGAGVGSFGFRRVVGDLIAGETHEMRSGDSLGTWDSDGQAWALRAVTAGVYTAGDGIGISGGVVSVALASNPGLEFSGGLLRAKIDTASGLAALGSGGIGLTAPTGGAAIVSSAIKVNTQHETRATQSAATTTDEEVTSLTVGFVNTGGGCPEIFVGVVGGFKVGNGSKGSCDCFFSGDAGSTARTWANITTGDALCWNGSIAPGGQLEAGDVLTVRGGSITA